MNHHPTPPTSPPTLLPALAALALLLALLTNFTTIDLDVFHEMALARQTFRTGHFPYHEFSSFTATVDPVIQHEWLSGFIFYAVATTTGATGFMIFKYLLVAALILLLVHTARRRGATILTLCLLAPIPAVVGCMGLTTIRAQLFTLIFSAALLALLEHARVHPARAQHPASLSSPPSDPHHLPSAPTPFRISVIRISSLIRHSSFEFRHFALWLPLQLLWQNLHGGFVVAPGILLCTLLENLLRKYAVAAPPPPLPVTLSPCHLVTPASPHRPWSLAIDHCSLPLLLLASLALIPLNPYGLAYLPFLYRSLTLPRPLILEWQPLWTGPAILLTFFLASLLFPLYALLRSDAGVAGGAPAVPPQCDAGVSPAVPRASRPRPRLPGILLLTLTALLALLHARHAALYALIWFAYVPAWIQHTPLAAELAALANRRPNLTRLVAALIILAALALALPREPWRLRIPTTPDPAHPTAPVYPAGVIDYLRTQNFRGNLMTPFEVGAYLSWYLLPNVQVGLDSRYEVAYDPAFVQVVHDLYTAQPHWPSTLAQIHPNLLLIGTHSPLATHAQDLQSLGWRLTYQDDAYRLYAPAASPLPAIDHRHQPLPATFP